MATITFRLSGKSDKATSKHEVLIRFRHGSIDQYTKTNVFVNPEYWSDKKQTISIPNIRLLTDEKKRLLAELHEQKEKLDAISALVQTSFQSIEKKSITNDWLTKLIKDYNIIRSMSRAGTPTDNPVNESLNGWIKEELIIDFKLKKCDDVPKLIEEYIYYYNNERPSYALKYKTPIQYKIESGF